MNKRFKSVSVVCLGIATAFTVNQSGGAQAVGLADTTVTIKAENTDLSGVVKSPKPRKCAQDRKVLLIKQIGTRGGGNDRKIASDTADLQGDKYTWSTGNTGIEGRFYAKVKATADCKADTSRTVRAQRAP